MQIEKPPLGFVVLRILKILLVLLPYLPFNSLFKEKKHNDKFSYYLQYETYLIVACAGIRALQFIFK